MGVEFGQDLVGLTSGISQGVPDDVVVNTMTEILSYIKRMPRIHSYDEGGGVNAKDLSPLIPVVVKLLEKTKKDDVIDNSCLILESCASLLPSSELYNAYAAFLYDSITNISIKIKNMGIKVVESKCSRGSEDLNEFIRSSFFQKLLSTLLDAKLVQEADSILKLFKKVSRAAPLSTHLGADFERWCSNALEENAIVKCRIYDLVLDIYHDAMSPSAMRVLGNLTNDLDYHDVTLKLNVIETANQLFAHSNVADVLEAIGFLPKVFDLASSFANCQSEDPLLETLVSPSLYLFFGNLFKHSRSSIPAMTSKYNVATLLRAMLVSDSASANMGLFGILEGIVSTKEGLTWLNATDSGFLFECYDQMKYKSGLHRSSALHCFASLLSEEEKYMEDPGNFCSRLFLKFGGIAGTTSLVEKALEEHDVVSAYGIVNNFMRFPTCVKELRENGSLLRLVASPVRFRKEPDFRKGLLRTVLGIPNVENVLQAELLTRFKELVSEKPTAQPAVAYVEL
ncbi:hypothetical protein HDU97_004652 [Phlyctochytrium planicorne]|nr:hypothetical protein HDU97_004652 [Phlyctochytrium planicorne]